MGKMFILEDDPDNLILFEHIVTDMLHFDLETALFPDGVIDRIIAYAPDVILLDIVLRSTISGVEVCQQLRALDEFQNTPIIALTAYDTTYAEQDMLAVGFSDYLTKPMSPRKLRKTVQRLYTLN